jgi:hypothetical protein
MASEQLSEPLLSQESSPTSTNLSSTEQGTTAGPYKWYSFARPFNWMTVLLGLIIGIIVSGILIGIWAGLKIGVFSDKSVVVNTTTMYPRPTLPIMQTTFRSS